jgi:hypothetical protein
VIGALEKEKLPISIFVIVAQMAGLKTLRQRMEEKRRKPRKEQSPRHSKVLKNS